MSKYTKEDIWRMIEEEDVEFIRLQFTDIFGTLKNVAVTTSQLERVLNNEVMFDGASIEGFARWSSRICSFARISIRLRSSRGDPSRERWRVSSVIFTVRMGHRLPEIRVMC